MENTNNNYWDADTQNVFIPYFESDGNTADAMGDSSSGILYLDNAYSDSFTAELKPYDSGQWYSSTDNIGVSCDNYLEVFHQDGLNKNSFGTNFEQVNNRTYSNGTQDVVFSNNGAVTVSTIIVCSFVVIFLSVVGSIIWTHLDNQTRAIITRDTSTFSLYAFDKLDRGINSFVGNLGYILSGLAISGGLKRLIK